MNSTSLPKQISLFLFVLLFFVLGTVWISLFSIQRQMDKEAAAESLRLVSGRVGAIQQQVSLIASDYHNWTDVYLNAQRLEYGKLASNYGITADRGDIFQYAELFDGPLTNPISWSVGHGLIPQLGIVSSETQDMLRHRVDRIDSNLRGTVDYFELRNDQVVIFSASYLLPEDKKLLERIDPAAKAIAVIGKVLSHSQLHDMEREFGISGVQISASEPQSSFVSMPFLNLLEKPVSWLEWNPPVPGENLLRRMTPIVGGISLALMMLCFIATRLLREKAKVLIEQEAISASIARTDSLTKLPNRLAFREHLEYVLMNKRNHVALIAIDLVKFKLVNDTVGHIGGDLFLIEFGKRMDGFVDPAIFVARSGGDEFFIVISEIDGRGLKQEEVLKKLSTISNEQIECCGVLFDVLASKGIASNEGGVIEQKELLRRADRAMYAAKLRRSQEVVCYDRQMEGDDLNYKRIETSLRQAIAQRSGFKMYYQPIVSAKDPSHVVRYEALARWTCSELGAVNPQVFIQVAERSGLILPLGWILLDLVCCDMKNQDLTNTSINVSPTQLMTPGFARQFFNHVVSSAIRPDQIEVEITEEMVAFDDNVIAQELFVLQDLGFRISLDDFGTGYSSIGYLTRMPFDVLKIDRSFSPSISKITEDTTMLSSMVGLARSMKLEIVAEGVETAEDANALRAIGVDYLQGYHFGRPAPVDELVFGG